MKRKIKIARYIWRNRRLIYITIRDRLNPLWIYHNMKAGFELYEDDNIKILK